MKSQKRREKLHEFLKEYVNGCGRKGELVVLHDMNGIIRERGMEVVTENFEKPKRNKIGNKIIELLTERRNMNIFSKERDLRKYTRITEENHNGL